MVKTMTHGMDNTHGIDLDSWYSIGTPESQMYERAVLPVCGIFCSYDILLSCFIQEIIIGFLYRCGRLKIVRNSLLSRARQAGLAANLRYPKL